MLRPALHRWSRLLIGAVFLTACSETPSELATSPAFAILDGARGGNAQFFFLPPMGRAATYSGTFDGSQRPTVMICVLAGTVCGTQFQKFSNVAVDPAAQMYSVVWKTGEAALHPERTYRVQVFVGTRLLGYADVLVTPPDSVLKTIDRSQYVIANATSLAIRFRIETGATTPGVWHDGDFVTFTQTGWDDPQGAAAPRLNTGFPVIYYASGGSALLVGTLGWGSASFTTVSAVRAFLPQSGPAALLNVDLVDPATTPSGALAGEAVALTLNVDFADAGYTQGASPIKFGDLIMCGFPLRGVNGMTVRHFLAVLNRAAPLFSGLFTSTELAVTATQLNASFANGIASQFAQQHLLSGPCPGAWKNGDVIAYGQESWGGDPATSVPAALLANNFDLIYQGGWALGVAGAGVAGYAFIFTSANAVIKYLPDFGAPPQPLTSLQIDPSSSSNAPRTGALGGNTIALQLNQDFNDAGLLPKGSSGLTLFDLRLCDVPYTVAPLSGKTVRELQLNVFIPWLIGVPFPYDAVDLWLLLEDIGHAFEGGVPTDFARAHLVNGPCS